MEGWGVVMISFIRLYRGFLEDSRGRIGYGCRVWLGRFGMLGEVMDFIL